ncbi:helix-turn-helix domain-containing protein [Paenibacillus sp. FSL K6-1330]|uniref:helix-turn-helix domain-containing protein n=1 Tax=Paenibacillus sp. FSL K6-1330 TaxID=2975292 RepID=UPI0030DD11A8
MRTYSNGLFVFTSLKVACDLLTHTGMKLDEIARATGFEYDTYFINQFTVKKGISPTKYRNITRKFATTQ